MAAQRSRKDSSGEAFIAAMGPTLGLCSTLRRSSVKRGGIGTTPMEKSKMPRKILSVGNQEKHVYRSSMRDWMSLVHACLSFLFFFFIFDDYGIGSAKLREKVKCRVKLFLHIVNGVSRSMMV